MEKRHPEFERFRISGMRKVSFAGAVKFYKDNGIVLTYVYGLMAKYPGEIDVYGADKLGIPNFPLIIAKGGKWLAEKNHRKLSDVPKFLNMEKEDLEKIQMKTHTPIHSAKEEYEEEKRREKNS
jgi:hypothetical protein